MCPTRYTCGSVFSAFGESPTNGGQVELSFGKSLESRLRDASKSGRVHLRHDAVFNDILGKIPGVHLAQHSFKFICGEHVAQDVEDLASAARVQIVFDLFDSFK